MVADILFLKLPLKDERCIGWHWQPFPHWSYTTSKKLLITFFGLDVKINTTYIFAIGKH